MECPNCQEDSLRAVFSTYGNVLECRSCGATANLSDALKELR